MAHSHEEVSSGLDVSGDFSSLERRAGRVVSQAALFDLVQDIAHALHALSKTVEEVKMKVGDSSRLLEMLVGHLQVK